MDCKNCLNRYTPDRNVNCASCYMFCNYRPLGHTKPSHITTNENNVYITIDGKSYKTNGGTMKLGPNEFCEIEVEACIGPQNEVSMTPTIKDVIFNPPATIVFWSDNTKTVVRAQDDDPYDPEKGLAMAISKKMLGNKYDYYHTFLHYQKKWDTQMEKIKEECQI